MKLQSIAVAAIAFLFMSMQNSSLFAQRGQGAKIDLFKTLKPGQWIKVEGLPQKDLTVSARKVKILTGDFQNDDWEVSGKARGINKSKKEFFILTLKIKANETTEYEGYKEKRAKTFKSFDDLKTGTFVEAEGTFLKDGTFLALQIEDETNNPKKDHREITFTGKIEKVDPGKKNITVMGVTFHVTDKTKVKSAIK